MSKQLSSFMVFFYSRSSTFQEHGYLSDTVVECYESVVSIASDATSIGAFGSCYCFSRNAAALCKSRAGKKRGYAAVTPTCRFVGFLMETALIARTKQDTGVEATAEEVMRQAFLKCVELTIIEQEEHPGLHLDDPASLLTSRIREHSHGDRDYLFNQKSSTFARTVSRKAAHGHRQLSRREKLSSEQP